MVHFENLLIWVLVWRWRWTCTCQHARCSLSAAWMDRYKSSIKLKGKEPGASWTSYRLENPVGLLFLIQYLSSVKCETIQEQESEAMFSFLIVKYSNHRTTETVYSTSVFLTNGNLPWGRQTICCQLCRGYIYHRGRECVSEGRSHWMVHVGNYILLPLIGDRDFVIFIKLSCDVMDCQYH